MSESIGDRLDYLDKKLDLVAEALKPKEQVPVYKKWSLPWKKKGGSKKKIAQGKALCVFLRDNRGIEIDWCHIDKGVIHFKEQMYGFEEDAVFIYQSKYPVVVVYEWRVLPIGGKVEQYKNRILGGFQDIGDAEALRIFSHGQKIIKREIELTELTKLEKKKVAGNWMMWILFGVIGLVAVYVLMKVFGKGG